MKLPLSSPAAPTGSTAPIGRIRRSWRVGGLLSSALLIGALFAACGPGGPSAKPAGSNQATSPATAQASAPASGPGSSTEPVASSESASASAQPSGVAAASPNALGSDLSNLDQLLNGMDDSLSQAGPSASGE